MNEEIVAHTPKVYSGIKNSIMNVCQNLCCCCCNCCSCLFSFSSFRKPNNLDLGPQIPGKKTLVLDLDETLIHSSFFPSTNYDFIVKFNVGSPSNRYTCHILKRPDLDTFLNLVKDKFEVVIFTASVKEYADSVIDIISPWVPMSHRFYRNHCTILNGMYIKDLKLFNRPLDSIIIVDNSEFSFSLQKSNAILVKTWVGYVKDQQLMKVVAPLLNQVTNVADVREVLLKQQW